MVNPSPMGNAMTLGVAEINPIGVSPMVAPAD
jgi:hypothetical protein